jgi:hypothetical protein
VAKRWSAAASAPPDDHLAGVDASARAQPHAGRQLELAVERLQRVAHLERCARRAQRVVLAHRRHTEHRHHRVADEFLHRCAMPFEHRAQRVEVARLHGADRFGVHLLAQRRRPHQVDEHDADGFAHRIVGRWCAPGRPAGGAEARLSR